VNVRLTLFFFRRALAALLRSAHRRAIPVKTAKNYLIQMEGMHFPRGSIVPAGAFVGGVDGHLSIGSITETKDPVNVEVPPNLGGPVYAAVPGESFAKNAQDAIDQSRAETLAQSGKLAEAQNENFELKAANEKLTAENVRLQGELESALLIVERRDAQDNSNAPIDPKKKK